MMYYRPFVLREKDGTKEIHSRIVTAANVEFVRRISMTNINENKTELFDDRKKLFFMHSQIFN